MALFGRFLALFGRRAPAPEAATFNFEPVPHAPVAKSLRLDVDEPAARRPRMARGTAQPIAAPPLDAYEMPTEFEADVFLAIAAAEHRNAHCAPAPEVADGSGPIPIDETFDLSIDITEGDWVD